MIQGRLKHIKLIDNAIQQIELTLSTNHAFDTLKDSFVKNVLSPVIEYCNNVMLVKL